MNVLNVTYALFVILSLMGFIGEEGGDGDRSIPGVQVDTVYVIANPSVPLDSISMDEVQEIFTLQQVKWDNGSLIRLIDFKTDLPVKDAYYRYLGFNKSTLKNQWLRIILSGEGQSPLLVRTEEEMLQEVMLTPGAIGYTSSPGNRSNVKILATISSDEKNDSLLED